MTKTTHIKSLSHVSFHCLFEKSITLIEKWCQVIFPSMTYYVGRVKMENWLTQDWCRKLPDMPERTKWMGLALQWHPCLIQCVTDFNLSSKSWVNRNTALSNGVDNFIYLSKIISFSWKNSFFRQFSMSYIVIFNVRSNVTCDVLMFHVQASQIIRPT